MARCVARYVALLIVDLLPRGRIGSLDTKKLHDALKRQGVKLDVESIRTLINTSKSIPEPTTQAKLYQALLGLLSERFGFDLSAGAPAGAYGDVSRLPLENVRAIDENVRRTRRTQVQQHISATRLLSDAAAVKAWAKGLRGQACQKENAFSALQRREDHIDAVRLRLCSFLLRVAYYSLCAEAEDRIRPDGQLDLEAASTSAAGDIERSRDLAVTEAEKGLGGALEELSALEALAALLGCSLRFEATRHHLVVNRLTSQFAVVAPEGRMREEAHKGAWHEASLMPGLSSDDPDEPCKLPGLARTSRLARQMIELAQSAQDFEAVLKCWDYLKDEQRFECSPEVKLYLRALNPDPAQAARLRLAHRPSSWNAQGAVEPRSIAEDPLLCAAAAVIYRYEVALGVNGKERRSRRPQAKSAALTGFNQHVCSRSEFLLPSARTSSPCGVHGPSL